MSLPGWCGAAAAAAPGESARETVLVDLDGSCQPPIRVLLPVPPGATGDAVASGAIDRYNTILVSNMALNRFILPEDIVVLAPAPPPAPPAPTAARAGRSAKTAVKGRGAAAVAAPRPTTLAGLAAAAGVGSGGGDPNGRHAIYVLGRRLLTVDGATAAATAGGVGGLTARDLAIRWARQLQQHLPRVCFRPPSLPEPVIPPAPPLRITSNLAEVGHLTGRVQLWDRTVLLLQGVQPGDQTAADRADQLSRRLGALVGRPGRRHPDEVRVRALAPPSAGAAAAAAAAAQVMLGDDVVLLTLTAADARAGGAASPLQLAGSVADLLRTLMERAAPAAPAPFPAVADGIGPEGQK